MKRKVLIIIVVSLFDIGFDVFFIDGEALLFSAAVVPPSIGSRLITSATLWRSRASADAKVIYYTYICNDFSVKQ